MPQEILPAMPAQIPMGFLISAKIEAGGHTADSRADDQRSTSMFRHGEDVKARS